METRLFLFSPNLGGHRLLWLRHLMTEASQQGIRVSVFCQDPCAKEFGLDSSYDINFVENLKSFKVHLKSLNFSPNSDSLLFWESDRILFQLLSFPRKSKMLVVRPYLQNWKPKQLFSYLYKLALIFTHKLRSPRGIRLLKIPYSTPLFFPNLWIEDDLLSIMNRGVLSSVAKESIRPEYKVGILIPGYINSRKSPEILNDIVEGLEKFEVEGFSATVFGSMPPELENNLNKFKRVKTVNKFLSDTEYFRLIHGSDLILLPYRNRGSSNVVLESMALAKPVVMSRNRHWRTFEKQFMAFKMVPRNSVPSYVATILSHIGGTFTPSIPFSSKSKSSLMDFFLEST